LFNLLFNFYSQEDGAIILNPKLMNT